MHSRTMYYWISLPELKVITISSQITIEKSSGSYDEIYSDVYLFYSLYIILLVVAPFQFKTQKKHFKSEERWH